MRQTTNDFHENQNQDVYLLNNPPRRCEKCRTNVCVILLCSLGISAIIGLITMLNIYALHEEYGSSSI